VMDPPTPGEKVVLSLVGLFFVFVLVGAAYILVKFVDWFSRPKRP
jgi:hypothetical protein